MNISYMQQLLYFQGVPKQLQKHKFKIILSITENKYKFKQPWFMQLVACCFYVLANSCRIADWFDFPVQFLFISTHRNKTCIKKREISRSCNCDVIDDDEKRSCFIFFFVFCCPIYRFTSFRCVSSSVVKHLFKLKLEIKTNRFFFCNQ